MTIYKNIKTGVFYKLLAHAKDTTNIRDGTNVVIYCCAEEKCAEIFVRELSEFNQKFVRETWSTNSCRVLE